VTVMLSTEPAHATVTSLVGRRSGWSGTHSALSHATWRSYRWDRPLIWASPLMKRMASY